MWYHSAKQEKYPKMHNIAYICQIDFSLLKNIFLVCAVDEEGKVAINRRDTRTGRSALSKRLRRIRWSNLSRS